MIDAEKQIVAFSNVYTVYGDVKQYTHCVDTRCISHYGDANETQFVGTSWNTHIVWTAGIFNIMGTQLKTNAWEYQGILGNYLHYMT